MSFHPPYHLRPNKAVDRLAFLDAIRRLELLSPLSKCTYYGFGGPYLEEYKLLYDFFPEIGMVSIEELEETVKRQKFHLPCKKVKLANAHFTDFLSSFVPPRGKTCVFWMDYTDLSYSNFADFMSLLPKLPKFSVVKISVKCQPNDHIDKIGSDAKRKAFVDEFGSFIADHTIVLPMSMHKFADLVQDLFRVAAEKAFKGSSFRFQPLSSFYYKDTVGMYSLTGIVLDRGNESRERVRAVYSEWSFAKLNWGRPTEIDLPTLSVKERLWLQSHLPVGSIKSLKNALGYSVGRDSKQHTKLMNQYAFFHRFFPYFMKVAT